MTVNADGSVPAQGKQQEQDPFATSWTRHDAERFAFELYRAATSGRPPARASVEGVFQACSVTAPCVLDCGATLASSMSLDSRDVKPCPRFGGSEAGLEVVKAQVMAHVQRMLPTIHGLLSGVERARFECAASVLGLWPGGSEACRIADREGALRCAATLAAAEPKARSDVGAVCCGRLPSCAGDCRTELLSGSYMPAASLLSLQKSGCREVQKLLSGADQASAKPRFNAWAQQRVASYLDQLALQLSPAERESLACHRTAATQVAAPKCEPLPQPPTPAPSFRVQSREPWPALPAEAARDVPDFVQRMYELSEDLRRDGGDLDRAWAFTNWCGHNATCAADCAFELRRLGTASETAPWMCPALGGDPSDAALIRTRTAERRQAYLELAKQAATGEVATRLACVTARFEAPATSESQQEAKACAALEIEPFRANAHYPARKEPGVAADLCGNLPSCARGCGELLRLTAGTLGTLPWLDQPTFWPEETARRRAQAGRECPDLLRDAELWRTRKDNTARKRAWLSAQKRLQGTLATLFPYLSDEARADVACVLEDTKLPVGPYGKCVRRAP